MEVLLLIAAVMTVMVVTTGATAGPAFAAGSRPGIGGAPPGYIQRNPNADNNPSTDDRTIPRTGGIKFAESCDKPASFCG